MGECNTIPSAYRCYYYENSIVLTHQKEFQHLYYSISYAEHDFFSPDFRKYARSRHQFHRTRRKRSYRSKQRTVETLVVLDKDMYKSHGRENVTTYVLSIFNIVST